MDIFSWKTVYLPSEKDTVKGKQLLQKGKGMQQNKQDVIKSRLPF